ncbi:MAG TPA: ATP-binding protein [Candidatus Corynebacterium gallistercoris]|uniref:ATP-binding protein n=1 Tax=Candidatus Corynebacterium gallistercoris TaxID=2838530 RepID=A0A9D1RY40_9CORY|nr:ATP-binding protein [Candidatus Corynebacterium gallistercoris]
MTTRHNPFKPSFGASPYYLAGREELLQDFELSLMEGPGSPYRAMLISGLRGVGKTVLLNEVEDKARTHGWVVIRSYPTGDMVSELVSTTIPQLISQLSPPTQRQLMGGSIAGIGGLRSERHPDAQALEIQPTLISRLRELASLVTETGILITLDELQSAHIDQLHRLATAVQDLMRDDLNISLVCAGLPHGIDTLLQHEGTTFLRRAYRVDLHEVSDAEVSKTLNITATDSGLPFTTEALEKAGQLCRGYPYLIQLVGALSWSCASLGGADEITAGHVEQISDRAISRLTNHVHRPALRGVPEGELNFLRAMVRIAEPHTTDAPVKTADIAAELNTTPQGISVWRARLTTRDLIAPAGFGRVKFTLPYMSDYIRSLDR